MKPILQQQLRSFWNQIAKNEVKRLSSMDLSL